MSTAQILGGRIGAYRKWSKVTDRSAATEKMRQAFLDRFERQVDPEGKLSPEQRARMAEAAKKAYFAELALKRHRARRAA